MIFRINLLATVFSHHADWSGPQARLLVVRRTKKHIEKEGGNRQDSPSVWLVSPSSTAVLYTDTPMRESCHSS